MKYQELSHIFKNGEILTNNNGCEYEVVEVISQSKVKFKRVKDGEMVIGSSPKMFLKDDKDIVLEWSHGTYL